MGSTASLEGSAVTALATVLTGATRRTAVSYAHTRTHILTQQTDSVAIRLQATFTISSSLFQDALSSSHNSLWMEDYQKFGS